MQFSSEVNWSLFDFIVMGILLLVFNFGIHFILRTTLKSVKKISLITLIILLFLFIWAELALGIIGFSFSGN
jgi:predicted Kef-type K+ transport protein